MLRTRARLAKNRTRAHYADIHSHPASFECHFQANAIPCRPDKKRKQGDTRQANVSAQAYRIFSQVHGCNIAGICKPAFHRRREARGAARRIHQRECPTTHLAKRAEKNPPSGKKCTGERKLLFRARMLGSRSGASRRI
jgi:hypothetical protein